MEHMTPYELEKFSSQLKPIIDIIERKQLEQQDKRKRGELFNVFDAFRIDHNELAWSAFLATLLDPKGSHGCGDLFLRLFPCKPQNFDITTAKADIEVSIGEIDKKNDYESGGRIDILITDASKHTIIIENKIFAQDQKKQLYRYWRFATENEKYDNKNFKLIYLTLNGHNPSSFSTDGKLKRNEQYICMSYKKDIIDYWLKKCMKMPEMSNKPKVTLIINQFIETILKLNSEMEMDKKTKKAIENAFNLKGDLMGKINALSGKVNTMPEVTKQMRILIDQYQQERIESLLKNIPDTIEIKKDGIPLSYWCITANRKDYNVFFSHDVQDNAIYIGVLFNNNKDEKLIKNFKLIQDPNPEKKNQYLVPSDKNDCKLDINDYDAAIKKLQEIVEYIKTQLK